MGAVCVCVVPGFLLMRGAAWAGRAGEPLPVAEEGRARLAPIVRLVFGQLFRRAPLTICLFGLIASLGNSMLGFATTPLFVKQFFWTATEFSVFSSYGSTVQVFGVILAGVLLGCLRSQGMIIVVALSISGLFSILVGVVSPDNSVIPVGFLIVGPAISVIGWIGFLSLAMKISNNRFAATQFAAVATMCNVGTVVGVFAAGMLVDRFDMEQSRIMIIGGAIVMAACFWLALMIKRSALVVDESQPA